MQFYYYSPEIGPEFMKKFFGGMDITYAKNFRQMTDWLAQGKFAICMGCKDSMKAKNQGLPVVATENGGPVDIIGNCHNGILVNPLKRKDIGSALLKLLADDDTWRKASKNGLEGVREHYTWKAHAESYLEQLESLGRRDACCEMYCRWSGESYMESGPPWQSDDRAYWPNRPGRRC